MQESYSKEIIPNLNSNLEKVSPKIYNSERYSNDKYTRPIRGRGGRGGFKRNSGERRDFFSRQTQKFDSEFSKEIKPDMKSNVVDSYDNSHAGRHIPQRPYIVRGGDRHGSNNFHARARDSRDFRDNRERDHHTDYEPAQKPRIDNFSHSHDRIPDYKQDKYDDYNKYGLQKERFNNSGYLQAKRKRSPSREILEYIPKNQGYIGSNDPYPKPMNSNPKPYYKENSENLVNQYTNGKKFPILTLINKTYLKQFEDDFDKIKREFFKEIPEIQDFKIKCTRSNEYMLIIDSDSYTAKRRCFELFCDRTYEYLKEKYDNMSYLSVHILVPNRKSYL